MSKAERCVRGLEEKLSELEGDGVSVMSGRRLYLNGHKGIIELSSECIEVGLRRGKLSIRGSDLALQAMNDRELIITGRIGSAEWE